MLAVDTNVLLRLLVDDPEAPEQCAAARRLASDAGREYVPQVDQIETVWVLERAYRVGKGAIVDSLARVAANAAYVLQRPAIFLAALESYRAGRADFSDYVILAESRIQSSQLATFDRKLGRHEGCVVVGA